MTLYTLRCCSQCLQNHYRFITAPSLVRLLSSSAKTKTQSHYETLGINKNASQADIKAAFLSRSKELHPDVNPGNPDSHNRFSQLNEAYNTLNKTSSRREYDFKHNYYENITQSYHGPSSRPGPSSMGHDEWHQWQQPYHKRRARSEDEFIGVNKKVIKVGISMFIVIYIWSIIVTRKLNKKHRSAFGRMDVDRYKRRHDRELLYKRRQEINRNYSES